mgnify:CR=1 FL=1
MRKLSIAVNWFLRLFLLIVSFTAIMGFIFLFRPEYFLDDIELFIENKLQDSSRGVLHIGTINGNFVTGFKVNDVNFYQDSTIIFSAKNIYIDPDLSRIIFGKIVLSKVIINSMYYKHEHTETEGYRQKYNLTNSLFNTEISSLIIDKGLIVASDKLLPVYSNQKMNKILKEIAKACGIHKNITFHVARHTFATTVPLSNGVPIETVSKLLGHTKLTTTQIYARVLQKKVGEDMQNLMNLFEAKEKQRSEAPKSYHN